MNTLSPYVDAIDIFPLLENKDSSEIENIAQRQSASRYLKELTAIDVLREVQVGKEKLFIHPKLMQLLADDGNAFVPY